MRSYQESSVSAKGPTATLHRKVGEQLANSLSRYGPPSPEPASANLDPLPSPHQKSPSLVAAPLSDASIEQSHLEQAEAAALRPFSDSNASSDGSPIMKLRAPSITTPSLRDFPVNADKNSSFESVYATVRQRTDSRPTISPSNTSRAISAPAPMPLPQALADHRPTARRTDGQRAESEVVRSRSSAKPFSFPARSSAQFTARERSDALQGQSVQHKAGDSMIRRFIRRASLKGKKSQSTPNSHKAPIPLSSELDAEASTDATRHTRRRSKSKDRGSSKATKSSSIFAPFLARDPSKTYGLFRSRREESVGGHLAPMSLDDDTPPLSGNGLPPSSDSTFLARDPDFAAFKHSTEDEDEVQSRDFAMVQALPQQTLPDNQDLNEELDHPVKEQVQDLDVHDDESQNHSPGTDQTHTALGTGMAPSTRNNFNFQDSLSLNELSATRKQRSDVAGLAFEPLNDSPSVLPSGSHSSVGLATSRPRPGIPRIWQGLEPADADHSLHSTHIDDADSSDDTPPDHKLPPNRFDTATTTSSFKTAVSSLDSPKSASTRRMMNASRASRVSLRTLDTPLARHFDQGPSQDSPLSDLISSIERRLSTHSVSGAAGSSPCLDTAASPSNEVLHVESDHTRFATADEHLPPRSTITNDGQHRESVDQNDEASLHALRHNTHVSTASHTALVETADQSNRNSLAEAEPPTSQSQNFASSNTHLQYRRETFGSLGSTPFAHDRSSKSQDRAQSTGPQLSRFSTALAGPEEDDLEEQLPGDNSEDREVVLPEVKVSEIESHLAAVEAALQDNRQEGSFDLTSLRQRMSYASYAIHANPSSSSMASREAFAQSTLQVAQKSADELTLPGAWAEDNSSFIMTGDERRRITLAPESHEALADAVRSVRRAISSSQLNDTDGPRSALTSRSVDTLGMESFMSDVAEPAGERTLAGEISMLSEATPARAAKKRQEGMRDIEEAYGRMLALVQSSAVGVTPSPQLRGEEGRLGFEPPRRPIKLSQGGGSGSLSVSPLAKASTKTDEPLSQSTQANRAGLEGVRSSQPSRIQTRAPMSAENRTSTSLSGLMGMPLDIHPHMLRQASISTVSSVQDVSKSDQVDVGAFRRRPPSDARSISSRYSQALSRDHGASSVIDSDGFRKRFSTDNTTVGRASSGGGHTSPSATAKTQGTPRSFATSISQHSLANMVRRHELEKESLLDTLERVRAENAELHARHESLTSDLHAEVTRVLELERELERRDSREVTLIGQIQDLEDELVELRHLDFQLNSSADQTLGSEDGEGSIMDVELPPGLQSGTGTGTGIGALPLSPRGRSNQAILSSEPFSSTSTSAQPKPTHRSTRSEAFVSGLPGSERSTLPMSRSELPRARPVSLLNGPGGLFREDGGSKRSGEASPLPTPRRSSLLRHPHRASGKVAKARPASPTLFGLSLPTEEEEMWNLADEHLPEIDDEIIPPYQQVSSTVVPMETMDSQVAQSGHLDRSSERDEDDEDQHSSDPSLIQDSVTSQRDLSGSMPRSSSQVTVTKNNTASQLPRPSATPSRIPTSRSAGGIADAPAHRSISSRLPRLGLKPSSRYSTAGNGMRSVSNATDKSTGSTLSSVYSTDSARAPPSLGSLPSGNNTMEDEIQAELARLGNPQPYMRYYSPPRSKLM